MAISSEEIFQNLDEDQAKAVKAIRGPVAIIAGAGSGKTRTITYRLAYGFQTGVIDPKRVLALTFTTKAANEIRARLSQLGYPNINARTFHSAALRQLMFFWPQTVGTAFPQIISNKYTYLNQLFSKNNLEVNSSRNFIRDLASEIEWAKLQELTGAEYQQYALKTQRLGNDEKQIAEFANLYDLYEKSKVKTGHLDFEDILVVLAGMLEEERSVREQVRDQYRFFTVDEYQDISPLSQKLLNLWIGNREEICVVGDPAQTIYSFSGATSYFLQDFSNHYPNAQIINLSKGYRSTPEIIDMAKKVITASSNSYGSEVISVNNSGIKPEILSAANPEAELELIINKINELQTSGVHVNDIAVLARTNAQLENLENALDRAGIENDGVTSVGKSDVKFFDRVDVKEAMRDIRHASVLSEPSDNWKEELKGILRPYENSDFIPSFYFLADQLHEKGERSLRLFLRELEDANGNNNPPIYPGVHLATLHSAKGLEWDYVFIMGANDRYLPYNRPWSLNQFPLTKSFVEEERRLLYVGLTRAKKGVFVSFWGEISPLLNVS